MYIFIWHKLFSDLEALPSGWKLMTEKLPKIARMMKEIPARDEKHQHSMHNLSITSKSLNIKYEGLLVVLF